VTAARAPSVGLCGGGPDGVLPDRIASARLPAQLMIARDTALWLKSSPDLAWRHSPAMPT
jgi:hypothetical protein